jgi:hypothetical protein
MQIQILFEFPNTPVIQRCIRLRLYSYLLVVSLINTSKKSHNFEHTNTTTAHLRNEYPRIPFHTTPIQNISTQTHPIQKVKHIPAPTTRTPMFPRRRPRSQGLPALITHRQTPTHPQSAQKIHHKTNNRTNRHGQHIISLTSVVQITQLLLLSSLPLPLPFPLPLPRTSVITSPANQSENQTHEKLAENTPSSHTPLPTPLISAP